MRPDEIFHCQALQFACLKVLFVDGGANLFSFGTVWPEPTSALSKETALSFLKRVMAEHTVMKAKKDATGTNGENESDVIDYQPY